MNVSVPAGNFSQDFCISKRGTFQPFKVIQGR